MTNFHFYLAADKLYHHFWHIFADSILEQSKEELKSSNLDVRQKTQHMLVEILSNSLKLLHPFMPFITEEIYSKLPIKNKKLLLVEQWPTI